MSKLKEDLSSLFELGRKAYEGVKVEVFQGETPREYDVNSAARKKQLPYVQFRCTCGYDEKWNVTDFTPEHVANEIKRHVDNCHEAKKALR